MTDVELVVGRGLCGTDIYVVPSPWVETATGVWESIRQASTWADLKNRLTPEWHRPLAEGLKECRWAGTGNVLTADTDIRYLGWYLTNVEPELIPEIGSRIFGHPLFALPKEVRESLEECGRYIGGLDQRAFYVAHPDAGDEVSSLLNRAEVLWRWDDHAIDAMLGTANPFPAPPQTAEPSENVTEMRLTAVLVTEDPAAPAWLRWKAEPLISKVLSDDYDHGEQIDEAWEAIREWVLQFLRQSLEKDPESWDWEILAETLQTDASQLTIDDWFDFRDYNDQAEMYVADGGPLPPEAFPHVAVWLEGTNLFDLGPLDLEIVSFRGELIPSEHDLWQTLNSAWDEWEAIADELEVEDSEDIQRLIYERHALATYRRHISPEGRIHLKPSAADVETRSRNRELESSVQTHEE